VTRSTAETTATAEPAAKAAQPAKQKAKKAEEATPVASQTHTPAAEEPFERTAGMLAEFCEYYALAGEAAFRFFAEGYGTTAEPGMPSGREVFERPPAAARGWLVLPMRPTRSRAAFCYSCTIEARTRAKSAALTLSFLQQKHASRR
jgi:hypothetical protein